MNFAGETPRWWRAFFEARRNLFIEARTQRGRDKASDACHAALKRSFVCPARTCADGDPDACPHWLD